MDQGGWARKLGHGMPVNELVGRQLQPPTDQLSTHLLPHLERVAPTSRSATRQTGRVSLRPLVSLTWTISELCSPECPRAPCGGARIQHSVVSHRRFVAVGSFSTGAFFGNVHGEIAAVDVAAVEALDGSLGAFGRRHLDEAEAA